MTNSLFKEIAFEALRKSYSEAQIFNLSFDRNVTKITEYFITVNLCKQLYEWNSKNHYQYKIEAEKTTFDFYKNCFEYYKPEEENNIFSKTLFSSNYEEFSKNLSSIRKGKIDITLSKETNGQRNISEYIIEVKSVNPTLIKLKQDFERIQKYLNARIPKFDNSLKGGYIVFIKHINKLKKVQFEKDLLKEKERYIKNISEHFSNISCEDINHSIHTNRIEYSPYENLELYDNDDYGEIAYNTFLAFSVVIEIKNTT